MSLGPLGFGQPLALLALLLLLPLASAWWAATRHTRAADEAYGGAEALRRGRSTRRTSVRTALLLGAITLVALALARPQWGRAETALERRGIDLAVVLDISWSMQATDIAPSRATAAAAGLREMLLHLQGDRVGMVTFGGTAFQRSPLTLDLPAIADLVTRAQRERALVRPGTDIGIAVNTALQILDVRDRAQTQVIVLISDGEDLGTSVADAVSAAKRAHIPIYTVAAGTEQGALVPAGEGARPGDAEVVSRADRVALARIASETGGSTRDVKSLAGLAIEFARLRHTAFEQGRQPAPIERFQWFLAAALVLLVAQSLIAPASGHAVRTPRGVRGAFSRAAAAAAVATVLGALLLAGCTGTPSYRAMREGNAAYAREDFAAALTAYREAKSIAPDDATIDYNLGNALHRLDRFEEAAAASKAAINRAADAITVRYATYALGNHALRRNALAEARDAYITVLQRDPADDDARHNLEIVLRALQPPPSTSPPQQQPGGASGPPATASPAPGAGAPPPQGSGGTPPSPGASGQQPGAGNVQTSAPSPGAAPVSAEAAAEAAARRALVEALHALDDNVATLEEATAILKQARRASEAGRLARPSGTPDPNDR